MGSTGVVTAVRGARGASVPAWALFACGFLLTVPGATPAQTVGVSVAVELEARRIDVGIDGRPFTSWIWPDALTKPVLHPIRTARGTLVTRGFPLVPVAGERPDHPHHAGSWLSYGDVNGVDFWNNSPERSEAARTSMGRHVQTRIIAAEGGPSTGVVAVAVEWRMPDGSVAIDEETTLLFGSVPDGRFIERSSILGARDKAVVFGDNKEGFLALRVARFLEQPSNTPTVLTDASGRATGTAVIDNSLPSGLYRTSEGAEGDAVWGARGSWAALTGRLGEEDVTVAILDDPANVGAPSHWHARGYGLFAANPLAQEAFGKERKTMGLTLSPGQKVRFRWRILILSTPFDAKRMKGEWKAFSARR